MAKKTVRFEYYRVCTQPYDKEANILLKELTPTSIKDVLIKLEQNANKRTYLCNNEPATLHTIKKIEDVWTMRFIRVRNEAYMPGKLNKNTQEYKEIELEDDELLGEEVTAIYDDTKKIIMVQRNRNSLSISGLQSYLQSAYNNSEKFINLAPITIPYEKRELKPEHIFRKIIIGIDPLSYDDECINKSSLGDILNIVKNKWNSRSLNLEISVGNSKRDNSLKKNEVLYLPSLAGEKYIRNLRVYRKEHEDTCVEMVDLLTDKLIDECDISYSKNKSINYDIVYPEMLRLYDIQKDKGII